MMRIFFVFIMLMPFQYQVPAQGPDAIAGLWITPGNKAIIQIEFSKGLYSGKVLQINPEGYVNGVIPTDALNEEVKLRSRSVLGINILSDISYDRKKKHWKVGQIYDPDRGKNYEGFIILLDSNRLKLKGHVPGKKWLGETEIWIRRKE